MGKDKDLKIKDKKARTTWGAPSYDVMAAIDVALKIAPGS
jgi:hypothetical protein